MTDYHSCLVHYLDPYDLDRSEFYLFDSNKQEFKALTADNLGKYPFPIVTYELHSLIRALRRLNKKPPEVIVDIEQVLKSATQLSKDQGGEKHWKIWRVGKKIYANNNEWKELLSFVMSKTPPPNEERKLYLFECFAKMIFRLWNETREKLEQVGELKRFEEIELPIQKIFWNREFNGLAVDEVSLKNAIENCKNEKYAAFIRISLATKTNVQGYKLPEFVDLINQVENLKLLPKTSEVYVEDVFEIRKNSSQLINDALTYCNANKNYTILKSIMPENGRIYPHFDCLGTVTSRVLVSNPSIQQLKKVYRKIITADIGESLVYLDYSQFEPGILAALSGDKVLIDAFNNSDIYSTLAERLFGSVNEREVAKKIFLAYCYGMSLKGIKDIFPIPKGAKDSDIDTNLAGFFESFPKLNAFRSDSIDSLKANGWVSSLLGNRRRRTTIENLSAKEMRWAMNHRIQATASLILKEAIIGISKVAGFKNILLPMHDAVLLQFNAQLEKTFVKDSISQMEEAFKKWCPEVNPKVKEQPFSEI